MGRKQSISHGGKGEKGGYAALYHCVTRSQAFINLTSHAVKLMNDLLSQYIGSNNGDLCATYSSMQKRGWKSKGTLNRSIKELLEVGFIEVSRQGGRHLCSLYAFTFYAVDECKGKLDIRPTTSPKGLWRKNELVPDIAILQRQKREKDDAKLTKAIMDRAKLEA